MLACGSGEYGVIGNGSTTDAEAPASIDAFNDEEIVQAVAGFDHSLALSKEGFVFSWGRNNSGQLGHSDSYMDIYSLEHLPRKIEVENPKDHDINDETVRFKQITAGKERSAAVSKDGHLYVWGSRMTHRPKIIDRSLFDGLSVIKVVCGGDSSRSVIAVLTEDYGLWTFGDTGSKMLGRPGLKGKHVIPERVSAMKGKKVLDVFAGFGQHIYAKVEVDISER